MINTHVVAYLPCTCGVLGNAQCLAHTPPRTSYDVYLPCLKRPVSADVSGMAGPGKVPIHQWAL